MSISTPTNTPQEDLRELTPTARVLVVALAWAAVMLFVIGTWVRIKRGEPTNYYTYAFYGGAAVAALLSAWQAFTLWFQKVSDTERVATLTQQRRLFGMVFLAGGLGLIGLAIALGIGPRAGRSYGFIIENLGESVGVLFFGLIALASGYALTQPPSESRTPLQSLVSQVPLIKFSLLILALGSAVLFVYLAYSNRAEQRYMDWLPELFTLVFASILFLACFLYLNAAPPDEFGVRLFVLIFGGALGVLLFCYSFGRMIFWRQDILLGGIESWQGANAYQFWTVFYLQFAALVLMFGSFNLARTDVRQNVYLRRVMYGYDAIVQALLVFEILVVFNIVMYTVVPYNFDWTKSRGAYALSEQTKNLVSGLKQETNMIVIMSRNDAVYRDMRNMLDNCQALSNKLKIEYRSPEDMEDYRLLERRFPKIKPETMMSSVRGVLIVNGPMPDKDDHNTPYAFVTDQKLAMNDGGMGKKPKRVFKGEEEIIKELKFLVQGKKRKVYILQGNEEADVNANQAFIRDLFSDSYLKAGLNVFCDRLKRDNYDVFGLSFGKEIPEVKPLENKIIYVKDKVPPDCDTLIVTATPKPLPTDVVKAIENYMETREGRLLVCLDVMTDAKSERLQTTGLEELLKKHSVEIADGFPIAVRFGEPRQDPSRLTATGSGSSNQLASAFIGRSIDMYDTARVLKAAEGAHASRFRAEPVLQLPGPDVRPDRLTIIETDAKLLKTNLNEHLMKLDRSKTLGPRASKDAVTVAFAVSESEGGKPRMVVVADTDFITNVRLMPPVMSGQRSTSTVNGAFAVSALEWMAEREGLGIPPKTSPSVALDQSVDTARMILLPGWIMLIIVIGLGLTIWIVRRR